MNKLDDPGANVIELVRAPGPTLPTDMVLHPVQPTTVSFEMVDGIATVSTLIHKAGTYIPQHAHRYPHASIIAAGRVAVWKDGEYLGQFAAPDQIVIAAEVKHLFQAMLDDTVVICVHNVARSGEIEIAEEHQLIV